MVVVVAVGRRHFVSGPFSAKCPPTLLFYSSLLLPPSRLMRSPIAPLVAHGTQRKGDRVDRDRPCLSLFLARRPRPFFCCLSYFLVAADDDDNDVDGVWIYATIPDVLTRRGPRGHDTASHPRSLLQDPQLKCVFAPPEICRRVG